MNSFFFFFRYKVLTSNYFVCLFCCYFFFFFLGRFLFLRNLYHHTDMKFLYQPTRVNPSESVSYRTNSFLLRYVCARKTKVYLVDRISLTNSQVGRQNWRVRVVGGPQRAAKQIIRFLVDPVRQTRFSVSHKRLSLLRLLSLFSGTAYIIAVIFSKRYHLVKYDPRRKTAIENKIYPVLFHVL